MPRPPDVALAFVAVALLALLALLAGWAQRMARPEPPLDRFVPGWAP